MRIRPTKLPQFITIPNNSGKAWPNEICESSICLLRKCQALSPSENSARPVAKVWKVSGPKCERGEQFRILYNQNLRNSHGPLSTVTTTKFRRLLREDK